MSHLYIKVLNKLKSRFEDHSLQERKYGVSYDDARFTGQEASDLIKKTLLRKDPAMICRFGQVELNCVINYLAVHGKKSTIAKSLDYIKGDKPYWWEEETINTMCNNAGFFPADIKLIEEFAQLMLRDIKEIDVLGSWLRGEKTVSEYLKKAVKVRLPDLEPYYHENPWTEALEHKKVLVIHPYEQSIQSQYKKRALLFRNPKILPEFELKTIKAVQSIANTKTGFKTWFDAYNSMCDKISSTDFDIALIGCGAYGLPLAAHVKRVGKKSVHIGGASQILFGIKGKRWEEHEFISGLMNEHWVRPSSDEIPADFTKVEDGCYW